MRVAVSCKVIHELARQGKVLDKQFTNSEVSLTSSEISPRFIQFGVSQFQGPQILHSSWLIQNLAPKWLPPQVRQQSGNQGEERFRIHTAFLVSAYEMQNKHQDLRARRNLPWIFSNILQELDDHRLHEKGRGGKAAGRCDFSQQHGGNFLPSTTSWERRQLPRILQQRGSIEVTLPTLLAIPSLVFEESGFIKGWVACTYKVDCLACKAFEVDDGIPSFLYGCFQRLQNLFV